MVTVAEAGAGDPGVGVLNQPPSNVHPPRDGPAPVRKRLWPDAAPRDIHSGACFCQDRGPGSVFCSSALATGMERPRPIRALPTLYPASSSAWARFHTRICTGCWGPGWGICAHSSSCSASTGSKLGEQGGREPRTWSQTSLRSNSLTMSRAKSQRLCSFTLLVCRTGTVRSPSSLGPGEQLQWA